MDGIVTLKVRARVRGEGPVDARLTNDFRTYPVPKTIFVPVPSAKVSLVVENESMPLGWEMIPEGQWAVVEIIEIMEPDR